MAEENGNNKLITVVLAIVITFAAIAILYVNLPQDQNIETTNNDDTDEKPPAAVIFTATCEDEILSYTLEELENLEAYSGSGNQIKANPLFESNEVIINGPFSLIGVQFTTILEQFENLPDNFNITVTASDGYPSSFTKDEAYGTVDVYNETGNVTETTGTTMILAYKEDGEYIPVGDDEAGPLRIGFVGDEVITLSNLWSKKVVSIEIIEE